MGTGGSASYRQLMGDDDARVQVALDEFFDRADVSGDGLVSFAELVGVFEQAWLAHPELREWTVRLRSVSI